MKLEVKTANGCRFQFLTFLGALVFGVFTFGIAVPFWLFFRYREANKNYRNTISWAYKLNINATLQTEYPEGIIYILENMIKELDKFGISDYQSYKSSIGWTDQDNYSRNEIIGIPNLTTLRNAIKMAHKISREWGEITRLGGDMAQIQAMDNIKNMIREEQMSLDLKNIKVKGGPKIYRFYFTEEDYVAVTGLNNNTSKSGRTPYKPPIPNIPKPPVNNPPSPPSQRVLTFEEYQQQHPSVMYLEPPERREEYRKYLASMGVQPPSSTTRPNYPDNSSYGTENKGDDSVWD